jgi:hypothetical protein
LEKFSFPIKYLMIRRRETNTRKVNTRKKILKILININQDSKNYLFFFKFDMVGLIWEKKSHFLDFKRIIDYHHFAIAN